jgi:DDE superfamily endonuclease/Homeodomain-like domain
MRRHPPHRIRLSRKDRVKLQRLVCDGRTEQRVARRARVLLAMARRRTVMQALAAQLEMSPQGIWCVCRRYEQRGWPAVLESPRSGRPRGICPLVRVQIEQLACCEPAGIGLHLTHWSSRSLAAVAIARGLVPHIAHPTVSLILRQAALQPHRCRYWKTPTLNPAFVQRASPILWCYEQVTRLAEREEVVLCWDEKPNVQALERPSHPMQPGQIQQQGFECVRHGTVNFAAAMTVHDGTMRGWCLDKNDSLHLCPALGQMFGKFKCARKIHLIWDNGPNHVSDYTHQFLRTYRERVRVLFTPAHAGWLNQGELLLRAFAARYLQRGDWDSRRELVEHLTEAAKEYDHLFAHPFSWSWTRRDLRHWVAQNTH